MNKQKKQSKVLTIILAIALVLLAIELLWLVFAHFGASNPSNDNVPTTTETVLQEEQESMPTEPIETEEVVSMPWEKTNAKQPVEYTWEEYRALTDEQQKAFQDYLGTEGFGAWLDYVQDQIVETPWDEPGTKQPADYTWEEFEALTAAQQIAFQDYLGLEAFEAWLDRVQKQPEVNPWEKPGSKQPEDYTMAEFEALSAAQQVAFQDYLGAEGFSDWMERVQPDDQPEVNPWEKPGAKQPKEYTWVEFGMLTAAQQMAFQDYLGAEGFSDWMERVQPDDQPTTNPWEKPGAKQPEDYAWAEFEALTARQQMAFQDYLGEEGFEAWMERAQPIDQLETSPWEKPGAKRPEDYTWEEFEALTGAQQMVFQDYLGEAGFEAWMNRVLGS